MGYFPSLPYSRYEFRACTRANVARGYHRRHDDDTEDVSEGNNSTGRPMYVLISAYSSPPPAPPRPFFHFLPPPFPFTLSFPLTRLLRRLPPPSSLISLQAPNERHITAIACDGAHRDRARHRAHLNPLSPRPLAALHIHALSPPMRIAHAYPLPPPSWSAFSPLTWQAALPPTCVSEA
ncbi:hypothetical protein B0H13DRAFT_2332995 [Mycena leptocephala]|nr:hypothetical protein B0H13DRAFT_2332995 [Mycena leptocephala]